MGAWAKLLVRHDNECPTLLELGEMSDVLAAFDGVDAVCWEWQRSSPRMGVASAFTLGRLEGIVTGIAMGRGVPSRMVNPATWRQAFGLDGKASGLALTRELLGEDPRIRRHDHADAVLIAWYGWLRVFSRKPDEPGIC